VKRRTFIALLGGAACVRPIVAGGRPSGNVARIGWLSSQPYEGTEFWPVFIEEMRALGWIEGRHFIIETMASEGHNERFPAMVAELLTRNVDVIVAAGTPPAVAAKAATSTTPIVFFFVGDPLNSGLVSGLAKPGGNATGMGGLGPGVYVKMLGLLKEALPSARTIGAFVNSESVVHESYRIELEPAAKNLDVNLRRIGLQAPEQIDAACTAAARENVDALLILGQPFLFREAARVSRLALDHSMPAMAPFVELARAGLMMSFGPRLIDDVRRLPHFLDRILTGTKPSDLPVEQPSRFYLTINLKSVRSLGLIIPQGLLVRADEVIQ